MSSQRHAQRDSRAGAAEVRSGLGAEPALRPPPGRDRFFADRMTVRVSADGADQRSDEPVPAACEGRASGRSRIRVGSRLAHGLLGAAVASCPAGIRSRSSTFRSGRSEQYERKSVRRAHGDKPLGQYVKAYQAQVEGPDRRAVPFARRRRRDARAWARLPARLSSTRVSAMRSATCVTVRGDRRGARVPQSQEFEVAVAAEGADAAGCRSRQGPAGGGRAARARRCRGAARVGPSCAGRPE